MANKHVESQIQRAIMQALMLKGNYILRINSGVVKTSKGNLFKGAAAGTPDLAGIRKHDKQGFFIEVKKPTGSRLSLAQWNCHLDFLRRGIIHGIAYDIQTALQIVENGEIGYLYPKEFKPARSGYMTLNFKKICDSND